MTRRQQAELGFDALPLEGALFSAEHLARVAHGQDEKTQREADYRIPRGLKLRDELVGRGGWCWRLGIDWHDPSGFPVYSMTASPMEGARGWGFDREVDNGGLRFTVEEHAGAFP